MMKHNVKNVVLKAFTPSYALIINGVIALNPIIYSPDAIRQVAKKMHINHLLVSLILTFYFLT